ncbi:acyl-CoA dehydrogenase family protein [Craterilacuibacter sp. RT1T]|uniref:acyl-CoA dehydrogenase family protein n=1 Tax=Craterilacuibacter sp. RT1T TaxID=2942211 RepID=UPI0020BDD563|nr:acyl-CoA dehydrogenase family protein [Craterilacuibacter sp. RT1T]MCL6262991.1 acyl-CoA dehydrogenase family protein [Craterilacuibacter sp. RT1T]
MYVELSSAQQALKTELADYFSRLMTPDARARLAAHEEIDPIYRELIAQAGRDGYLALGWPKEYGGAGMGPIEQLIYFETVVQSGAPFPFVTVNTVGPALMAHGSAAHKARFLPGIARGDIHFAIGYSEPDAGTDLAALKCSAVRDGDDFIVNGSKIWTSHAQYADYIWLAVRTDPAAPKHKGITILIVDAKASGVSVAPIYTLGHRTNATYFDNVRVPAAMVVGEVNGGWQLITSQLNHERIGLGAHSMKMVGIYQEVLAWAQTRAANGKRALDTGWVATRLAEAWCELEALKILNYRLAADLAEDKLSPALASAAKVFGTEAEQTVARKLAEVLGVAGLIRAGSKAARLHGLIEETVRHVTITSFGGGTNEIQREIIAQFGLGLPRVTR